MANYIIIAFTVSLMLIISNGLSDGQNNDSEVVSSSAFSNNTEASGPLRTLGQLTMAILKLISGNDDEKVEMDELGEFITAVAKAAVIVAHPQIPLLEDMKAEFISFTEEVQNKDKLLTDQVAALNQKLMASNAKLKMLEQSLNGSASLLQQMIELTRESKIGFTATIKSSTIAVPAGQNIKFDNVKVNEGNHYDPVQGTFTCPQSGLYMIYVTIAGYSTQYIYFDLKVNGTSQFQVYNHVLAYNSVSQSGLVKCSATNKIWVQSNRNSMTIYGSIRTMFSGYLYKKLESV